MTCKTCRWFLRDDTAPAYGQCQRHPPTVHILAAQPITLRPRVAQDETCGEWTIKETV